MAHEQIPLDEITRTAIGIAFVQGQSITVLARAWQQTPETIEEVIRQALIEMQLMKPEHPSPPGSYREARGAIPYDPTAPKPEVLIRRMRDGWTGEPPDA